MTSLPARLLVLTVLCGPAIAQSYAYSPADRYARIEGSAAAFNNLGGAPDGRYMLLDGQMRNRTLAIKEVAFRPCWHATHVGSQLFAARSWRSVSLHAAGCDLSGTSPGSPTFSQNPTSTPTRVFAGSMAWPHVFGLTSRAPFTIRFPFRTPYRHDGKQDLCLDFDFTGGTMANRVPWTSPNQSPYLMSGAETGRALGAQGAPLTLPFQQNCTDTRERYIAVTVPGTATYNAKHPARYARNTVSFVLGTFSLQQPKLTALGVAPIRSGLTLPGFSCGRLHIDTSQPTWYFATGPTNLVYAAPLFRFQQAFVDFELYAQSAWRDSVSGKAKLTQARGVLVPEMNPMTPPLRITIHQADPQKKRTSGHRMWPGITQPVIRYGY